jgi:hypothetical protein
MVYSYPERRCLGTCCSCHPAPSFDSARWELSMAPVRSQGSVYRYCALLPARASGQQVLPGAVFADELDLHAKGSMFTQISACLSLAVWALIRFQRGWQHGQSIQRMMETMQPLSNVAADVIACQEPAVPFGLV